MSEKIVLFGSSCNPPALHHRRIALELREKGFHVIVVPCGPRPDKLTVDDIDPIHRAIMTDMTFGGVPGIEVWLGDLEKEAFTRTYELQELFKSRGEIWHYVGADLVQGGSRGDSLIQRVWLHGEDLWSNSRFVIGERPGYPLTADELPPRHVLYPFHYGDSSTRVRERTFKREPIDDLTTPEVARYIERYGLYRGRLPRISAKIRIDDPRPLVVFDDRNPKATKLAFSLGVENHPEPNCIVVIGGDGMMLHTIKEYWRRRLPFFGINMGHRGFLLNNVREGFTLETLRELIVYQHPLLFVEVFGADGTRREFFAFNDAWMERTSPQTAWLTVSVDGDVKFREIKSDGVLIATPAGSSAYAHIMGATPMRIGSRGLLLVGNNVIEPWGWKAKPLPADSSVIIRSLDPDKRPVRACIDNEFVENAVEMRVRASRTAAVELTCLPDQDLADKLEQVLFRKGETHS